MKSIFLAGLALVLLVSCTSVRIENSWRDPDISLHQAKLNKFIVAAVLKDQTVRRQVEDQMASLVPGKAIQSYKEFGSEELKQDDEAYHQKLKASDFDGILVMRITSIDSNFRYARTYPSYYTMSRNYWRVSWTDFYSPVTYPIDKTYNIEVTVYSFRSDKLIWSGSTSIINPSGSSAPYKNISKEVYRKMKDEKFLL